MKDPIILCFKNEFERFFGFLEKQIAVFPDELWEQKQGGYLVWQQMLHTIACIEFYARPEGEFMSQTRFTPDVLMLSATPSTSMTKKELSEYAQQVKNLADSFIDGLTTKMLTMQHEAMTKAFGKEMTLQNALMAMIRHTSYHLGCCDTILRDQGLPGVY